MLLSLLLAFQLCPPNAEVPWCIAGVSMYRTNGTGINSPVPAGVPVIVSMTLLYWDFDPLGRTASAFHAGRMILTIDGTDHDVTPTNGVPWLGPQECAPSSFLFVNFMYTPTNHADMLVNARYVGGETTIPGAPVSASQATVLTVMGPDLHIWKRPGGSLLWFYGTAANYAIQHSTNLLDWTQVETQSPDANGLVQLTVTGDGFWRYQRL